MLYYLRQEVVGNQAERILEGADSRWVHFHRLSLSPVIFKDFFLPRQHVLKRGLGELMVKKNLMNYYFSLFLSVLVTSLADSFLLWQMDQAVPLLAKYWSFFFLSFFSRFEPFYHWRSWFKTCADYPQLRCVRCGCEGQIWLSPWLFSLISILTLSSCCPPPAPLSLSLSFSPPSPRLCHTELFLACVHVSLSLCSVLRSVITSHPPASPFHPDVNAFIIWSTCTPCWSLPLPLLLSLPPPTRWLLWHTRVCVCVCEWICVCAAEVSIRVAIVPTYARGI